MNSVQSGAAKELCQKELFIFDMDGTIYLGGIVFDFAVRFINRLRKEGKRVLFFTNNASHNFDFYIEKLTRLGFSPKKEEIMTAGDVTAEFLLRHRAGKSVYLVGTADLEKDFRTKGIRLVDENEKACDIVVTSFDTSLTYAKLDAACRYIREGSEYLCTHPDFNCPTETGFMPDSGAIAALITASTGVSPTYFGKPYPYTVQMIEEATGVDRKEMCIFGDRLYTDIALGKRHGVCSVLVLSGETRKEDLASASAEEQPDYTFASLKEVDQLMFAD